MAHILDNVIWQALTTRQTEFAESCDQARRFQRDVTSLTAFQEDSDRGYASVANLVGPQGTAALFLDTPYETRAGWDYVAGAPMLEMVHQNGVPHREKSNPAPEMVELGFQESAEMLALATLAKPGPFGTRTHELGSYVGIRCDGKLAAMAGERLKVPGYTEVSAVCTHPDHVGKGYARALMTEIMRRIRERGETPMLHVRADNTRAVRLYEQLGFRIRKEMHFAVLRRSA
jgi:ribosomal protein S18 acetylase RimI-like enzyme